MYEEHFGLVKSPFSSMPDPHNLYMTAGHREALAGLSYTILYRKGFAALVGEAGTGKTSILRRTLEIISHLKPQACMVVNPVLTSSEFIEFFLQSLGLRSLPSSKAQRLLQLEHVLTELQEAGMMPLLIVDEAHKLDFHTLEEIRLLSNLEHGSQRLLQIVLAGQPELDVKLNQPEFWQLKQRISIRLRIEQLNRGQIAGYVLHRWARCGGGALPFTDDAISLISVWSSGSPRLINIICDNALLLAFSTDSKTVSAHDILDVVRDLDLRSAVADGSVDLGSIYTNGKPRSHSILGHDIPVAKASNGAAER